MEGLRGPAACVITGSFIILACIPLMVSINRAKAPRPQNEAALSGVVEVHPKAATQEAVVMPTVSPALPTESTLSPTAFYGNLSTFMQLTTSPTYSSTSWADFTDGNRLTPMPTPAVTEHGYDNVFTPSPVSSRNQVARTRKTQTYTSHPTFSDDKLTPSPSIIEYSHVPPPTAFPEGVMTPAPLYPTKSPTKEDVITSSPSHSRANYELATSSFPSDSLVTHPPSVRSTEANRPNALTPFSTPSPGEDVLSPSPKYLETKKSLTASPTHLQTEHTLGFLPTNAPTGWPTSWYYYPTRSPASFPTDPPVYVSYVPGRLSQIQNGLELSKGLRSRLIAESGKKVRYKNGRKSKDVFHGKPDGAATFELPNGGWIYVSNSEQKYKQGGVGAITFDRNGKILNYEMILKKTSRNCSGGKMPWGSFVSCEENKDSGQCWETDPRGKRKAQKTRLGGKGGNYEAVAVDYRDPYNPLFFLTNDKEDGEIRRFTPKRSVVKAAHEDGGDYWDILGTSGKMEYLVLSPASRKNRRGTFRWSSNLKRGKKNAKQYFQRCEGMDIIDGKLYFVSATQKDLFELDLDRWTYKRTSTLDHKFTGKPDGVIRNNDILYFTEEYEKKITPHAGVYGRDLDGNYFTLLKAVDVLGDATGVSFSPSKRHLYVAYQKEGKLFEITRKDGLPFDGRWLDVKYHYKMKGDS